MQRWTLSAGTLQPRPLGWAVKCHCGDKVALVDIHISRGACQMAHIYFPWRMSLGSASSSTSLPKYKCPTTPPPFFKVFKITTFFCFETGSLSCNDLKLSWLALNSWFKCWDYKHTPPCPANNIIYVFMYSFIHSFKTRVKLRGQLVEIGSCLPRGLFSGVQDLRKHLNGGAISPV